MAGGPTPASSLIRLSTSASAAEYGSTLRLSPEEIFLTRVEYGSWLILTGCGAISALLAGTLPDQAVMYAPFVYMSLPIIMPLYGSWVARQWKKLFGLPEFADTHGISDQ